MRGKMPPISLFSSLGKAILLVAVVCGSALAGEKESGITRKPDENTRIEASFLQGMRYLNEGKPKLATEQFLLILAKNPSLVRVRLELARAYFLNRQWKRSRNEFFRVLSGDLPDSVRANVLDFIRAIDARRGFDWDLGVGITSIGGTRDYKTDEVLLSLGGVELPFELARNNSSDIGLKITGSANFRKPWRYQLFGKDTASFASISLDLQEARASLNDDYQVSARMGIRILSPRTTFSIGPVISTRVVSREVFEHRHAWNATFEYRDLLGGSFFGFLNSAKLYSRQSSDLDGYETAGELGYRRSVSGRNVLGFSLFFEDKNVDYSFEDYLIRGMRFFGSFELRGGLTVSPSMYISEKSFRNASPLLVGDPDEISYGLVARMEKSNVFFGNGFSPFAEFRYGETLSGIDAFSFRESAFIAGMERRF